MREPSKKKKPLKKIFIILGIIFIISALYLISFFLNKDFLALRNNPFGSTKLNILVLGYDDPINGPPRADTIILASIDLSTKQIGLVSIPRDTRVNIPGYGTNRVNASHAFGGVELTVETLESFMDINIDYYLETDFMGFTRIIDALGGVSIDVERKLHYIDKAGDLYINLPAGRQLFNGEEALQYVRYRESIKGDIGRVERQQKFVKAVFDRVLNTDVIMKIPTIYKELRTAVHTNIPFQDISPFAHILKEIDFSNIETATLPGDPRYVDGVSYWIADQEKMDILINSLINSKEYINNRRYKLTIFNGNGVVGFAQSVAGEMAKHGFQIVRLANADHYDYETTIIRYFDNSNKTVANNLNKIFNGEIEYKELEEEKKDEIEIILGADLLDNNFRL
ncbi:MAG TPA: LCP family protein [Halanaerobiales bacterium]|nr:LCP family protein [Halanaerobiales bacterium]